MNILFHTNVCTKVNMHCLAIGLLLAVAMVSHKSASDSVASLLGNKIKWSDGKLFLPDVFGHSRGSKKNGDPFRSSWNPRPSWGSDRPAWESDRPSWGSDRPSWGSDRPSWGSDRPEWGSYRSENGEQDEPDMENDIDPTEPTCILTSSPPDPDSHCCGVDATSHNRIIGGKPVQIEQYPWLVHIEYYDTNKDQLKRLCGGFLISGKYVLSAAHCFTGEILKFGTPVNVILGEYNTTNEGTDCVRTSNGATTCTDGAIKLPIEKHRAHPKYLFDKVRNLNDIAIVRMKHAVQFTKYIRPLCLPTSDVTDAPPPNLRFHTAGWGAIKHEILMENGVRFAKMEYDDVKRDVDVPFIETEKCRKQFKFLTKGHLCAGGEKNKDACKGDSGGPLMYRNDGIFEAVGIVSTGSGKYACGTEDRAGVYTNVYQYLDWIKDNIEP